MVIDQKIIDRIDQVRPQYMDRTTFINFQLDGVLTLNWPSRQAPGSTAKGGGHLKEEKDVENLVLAEEAHLDPKALKAAKKAPVRDRTIPESLNAHEALIRDWWAVKPKAKTNGAWSLAMTELTKLQDRYGDSVVRDQLVQAEAFRWQGVSLRNYERYGMDKPNTPQEPSTRHPAHQVFRADDLGPEWDVPSVTGGKGVLEGMF